MSIGPEIGKLYKVSGKCCETNFEFMAKLIEVTQDPDTKAYRHENGHTSETYEYIKYNGYEMWRFLFDNGATAYGDHVDFKEIKKWHYWDSTREIKGDPQMLVSLPFSVLCTDCGGMLKALTEREVVTLGLPTDITEECTECGDDATQTVSAQFDELMKTPD